jgi:hypothetical protein
VDGSELLAGVVSAALWTLVVLLFWWGRRRHRYDGLNALDD